jgi:hypothetical protein
MSTKETIKDGSSKLGDLIQTISELSISTLSNVLMFPEVALIMVSLCNIGLAKLVTTIKLSNSDVPEKNGNSLLLKLTVLTVIPQLLVKFQENV